MASVPILATGRDTGVYLDNTSVTRSAERLRNDILNAEGMKLEKTLKDEADFIKAMSVDPVALMTQAGIEQQSKAQEQFNEKWGREFQRHKGNLPTEKKIQMQKDRVGLESFQQNLAANQQRALQEMQLYQRSPSKYDSKAFEEGFLNFLSTGEYTTGLRKNPAIATDVTKKLILDYRDIARKRQTSQSVGSMNKVTTLAGTVDDAKKFIMDYLGVGEDADALVEFWAKEFENAPMDEKKKYFDFDEDGTVTDEEIALSEQYGNAMPLAKNPIIKWKLDKLAPQFVGGDETLKNKPSSIGYGASLNIGGKKVAYQVPERIEGDVALSDNRTSRDYYKTYVDKAQNFILGPSARAVVSDTEMGISEETEIPPGVRIDAKIVGYARDLDMVELQPTSGVGSLKNVQKILVPRSEVPPELLQGVTIKIGDKIVPIGEGKEAVAKKKTFNPSTGKFE